MRIRILQILSGDLWAGAEVVAARLLGSLQKYPDMDLEAIVLNEGKLSSEIRRMGISLITLEEGILSFPMLVDQMRKLIRHRQPDIVHAHRYKENLLAWIGSVGNPRTRLVATQHGMPEIHSGASEFRQKLVSRGNLRLLSSCFDIVVAVSEEIRNAFVSLYGFKPGKVRVIHNGIDIPNGAGIPYAFDGRVVVGSSGRFFPVKDYPLLVNIAKEVIDACPNTRFELAGEGPERRNIEERIRASKLEGRFLLRGFVDDMPSFYRGLNLYLNTSWHEGIPMSVLEAMANGLPVVVPKVGGLNEIVQDGIQGFLVPDRSPVSFAERITHLIRDVPTRRRMAYAARERVSIAFTAPRMASEYHHVYSELIRK